MVPTCRLSLTRRGARGRALIARVPAAGTGEDPRIRVKRLRGSVTGTGRKTGQCCTPPRHRDFSRPWPQARNRKPASFQSSLSRSRLRGKPPGRTHLQRAMKR
ncbi:hypothetical protein ACCO45_013293 [Purpureocillium lilacinum]|uniref:Uncharacterized protein n=1 Tax=Purpureocillium lilacinum TaxID=33203 RepID=A0ACC4DAG2_PURLI